MLIFILQTWQLQNLVYIIMKRNYSLAKAATQTPTFVLLLELPEAVPFILQYCRASLAMSEINFWEAREIRRILNAKRKKRNHNQIFCFSKCSNDTADRCFHNPNRRHKMTVYAVTSSMDSRFSMWFVYKDGFSYQFLISTVPNTSGGDKGRKTGNIVIMKLTFWDQRPQSQPDWGSSLLLHQESEKGSTWPLTDSYIIMLKKNTTVKSLLWDEKPWHDNNKKPRMTSNLIPNGWVTQADE